MTDLPWMKIAWSEADSGVKEIPGPQHNPRILEYHHATGLRATDDETPWCGSFLAFVMMTAKIPYNKKNAALARSWLEWGEKLDQPIPGCIVVFRRGSGGHVGFLVAEDVDRLQILGGNQSNAVKISAYKKADVLGYRWPSGYPKPGPKPMTESRTVKAATVAGAASTVAAVGGAVKDATDNVYAATTSILGLPVWVFPIIAVAAVGVVLFLLWQDRRKGARE